MATHSWFWSYAKAIGGWWWATILGIATLGGGIPGLLYFAEKTGMSPLIALLLALLVASVLLNGRQAFVWRGENAAKRAAEDRANAAKVSASEAIARAESAERAAKLSDLEADFYRFEADRWWTRTGLHAESKGHGARRIGDSPFVNVEVTSDFEIQPLRLRYWFNCDVAEKPIVQLRQAPAESGGDPTAIEPSEESSVTVHPGGRVEIYWLEDSASLGPGAALRLAAWPKDRETEIELRSVERLWRVY